MRPDWHNGLPPTVLSLTLWGETPHRMRWRDPPETLMKWHLQTHTHNHRRTITRYKAPNWLAWLCVNTNWVRGSSCCYKHFSQRWRGRGRERDISMCACVCIWIGLNQVSRCAVSRADSQLPVCEAGALLVFLSEPVLVFRTQLDNAVSCLSSSASLWDHG